MTSKYHQSGEVDEFIQLLADETDQSVEEVLAGIEAFQLGPPWEGDIIEH